MFRVYGSSAPGHQEFRVPRTAMTAGMMGVVAAAVSAGLLLSASGGPSSGRLDRVRASTAVTVPSGTVTARQAAELRRNTVTVSTGPASARPDSTAPASAGPASTLVATVLRAAPRYASPGHRAAGTVPATWYGRPSVLPVIAARPGWVRVRLAQRPNGSTAWLPAGDVALGRTRYRIVVDNATTRLALYDRGRLAFSVPAGVGSPDDPTPRGHYFVAFDEPPPHPNPGYGPFIIVTSAHSPAISDWQGTGDAIIGIHGPLGEDRAIGTAGARISHGCVRLHDQALERLVSVPPGTPVDVVG